MKPAEGPDPSKPVMPSPSGAAAGGAAWEDERRLVERARRGDEAAFRRLVEAHQARAYALALRILRSPADAEEVAQDAFVRAWSALREFRGESSFGTWLHRIVARRAFDRAAVLRHRRGREAAADAAPEPAGPEGDEDALQARRLQRLIAALTPAQRAAVTLYYYEGRSVEQVAELLEMPENTVKTHLARARAALRAGWRRETGEGA